MARMSRRCCDRPHSSTSDSRSLLSGVHPRAAAGPVPSPLRGTATSWAASPVAGCPMSARPPWAACYASRARSAPDALAPCLSQGAGMMPVMEPTSLRFAPPRPLARRGRPGPGLRAPTFRSPPRIPDVTRSIVRRGPAVTVAVALRDRPWPAVVADMVEGVVAARTASPASGPTTCARGCGRWPPRGESGPRDSGRVSGRRRRAGSVLPAWALATLRPVRSTRVLVERVTAGVVGGAEDGAETDFDPAEITYADVFVVVRDGETAPGPNDWEVTLQTRGPRPCARASTTCGSRRSTARCSRAGRCCGSATAAVTCSGATAR